MRRTSKVHSNAWMARKRSIATDALGLLLAVTVMDILILISDNNCRRRLKSGSVPDLGEQ